MDDTKLQLDPNPTPNAESQQFSNPDDVRRGQDHAHELALLDRKQGSIGKMIGSSESNLTIAFVVIILSALCCIGCLIGMVWQPAIFLDAMKFFGTTILTVSGYVFGVKTTSTDS